VARQIALIGNPLSHSISPAFQQAAIDYYSLDAVYEKWETEPRAVEETLNTLRGQNCIGANVTVPHKETVIPYIDTVDDLARVLGAINTIVNRSGRLFGYNTDGEGFLRALREQANGAIRGRQALVLGAGGAARAVVMALLRARMVVTVANRTKERADRLVDDLIPYAGPGQLQAAAYDVSTLSEISPRTALIVNCTTVGMRHSPAENESPLPADLLPGQAIVFDIIANPLETKLLQDAKRRGARTINGLSMLVYQGAAAFELWTGMPAPVEAMMAAAKEAMGLDGIPVGSE
jgi:shikimate dehydrogenase